MAGTSEVLQHCRQGAAGKGPLARGRWQGAAGKGAAGKGADRGSAHRRSTSRTYLPRWAKRSAKPSSEALAQA